MLISLSVEAIKNYPINRLQENNNVLFDLIGILWKLDKHVAVAYLLRLIFLKKINSTKKMTITISPEHGYVILAASGTFLLNVWQMMKIGGKRKELGIAVSLEGISSTYILQ